MSEGTIDRLEIEFSSNAAKAAKSINELASTFNKLSSSVGKYTASLQSAVKSISALQKATSSINLSGLKELNNLKISSSFGKNLDALANAISKLPGDSSHLGALSSLRALSGIKLSNTLGVGLSILANATKQLPADASQRISGLHNLSAVSNVKISATVGKNLALLAQAVRAFPADASTRLQGLAKSILPLKGLSGLKIAPAIKYLRQLPEVLKQYETLNISNLVKQFDQLIPRIRSLAASTNQLKIALKGMPASFSTVAAATKSVVAANKAMSASNVRAGGTFTDFFTKILALGGSLHFIKRGISSALHEFNSYIENMNLFNAAMGEYAQEASQYAETVQNAMGIDMSEWTRNQGVFQTLITGMGETADRANVMSRQLTQLAYDISSFYNIPVEDAMLKIQSGVSGELEPMRRLGWDLSDARMQLEATQLGIEGNTNAMTQAEKVALRYYMIMNQVTIVHGDMARTIASPANQLRVLQAQVTMAARSIGALLIPMLNMILPYAIAAAKAIRILATALAKLFGVDASFDVDYSTLDTSSISTGGTDNLAKSLDNAGSSADKAAKKMKEYKNTVMGFDELNKLNEPPEDSDAGAGIGGAGGGGAGGGGFDLPLDTYDFMEGLDDYLSKLTDGIAENLVNAFKKVLPIVAGIGTAIGAWKLGKALSEGLEKLSGHLNNGAKDAEKISARLRESGNTRVANAYSGIATGMVNAATAASNLARGMNGIKFAGIVAAVAVMVARFVDLYLNSEKFRDGLSKIGEYFVNLPNLALGFVTGILDALSEAGKAISEFFSNLFKIAFNIDLSGVMQAFQPLIDTIGFVGELISIGFGKVVDGLDLDVMDLGITVAGLAMVISGVGAPIGAALLVFEGVSLAIRAIGWATEPCVEQMDALADVSEETAGKLGTSVDSMQGVISDIDSIKFSNAIVNDDDVADVEAKVTDITNTILNNLDSERNEELAQIDAMAGFMTPDEVEAAKARVNQAYDEQKAEVQSGLDEINQIMREARDNGVSLTQEQSDRIKEIMSNHYDELMQSAGASKEEISSISAALANNQKTTALETAQTVMQAAWDAHEAQYQEAQKNYDEQMTIANRLYDANDISEERYNEMVAQIQADYATITSEADQNYEAIKTSTQEGLGDVANEFDFQSNEIKDNWTIFTEEVGKTWDTFCTDTAQAWNDFWSEVGETWDTVSSELQQGWSTFCGDIENAWNTFCSDIENAWENMTSGIKSFYHDNIEPLISDLTSLAQDAGAKIGQFLTDPIASIKQFWSGVSSWFTSNVYNPIKNTFAGIVNAIKSPINRMISLLNRISIDVPEWARGAVGGASHIGFNIPYLASGGFVDEGQLFVAREAGPEMVGKMGSRSVVANNQQIVDGIEAGVTKAIIQVLPSIIAQSASGGDIELTLNVGHEELARAVNKGNASLMRRGAVKTQLSF